MSTNSENLLSLIERKKLQWAKEKEELAKLNEPWSVPEEDFIHYDRDSEKMKRSSLPPLSRNQYNSYDKYVKEKEIGGETSGYGSDNPNQSPEYVQIWHQSGYESSSSRDDRLKWNNKSVAVNNFCQSKEEPLKKTGMSEPPNWVKRGLKDGEILVNNTSPAESPEQRFEEDRPQTSSSYSQNRSNFIRGQNIPIDPIELSERERRRQAALAHQDAILQQLDERERRRQKEKERKIKEEFEEELRIEREREVERKRKEQEIKIFQERLEKERKRKEVIEEAIEQAQKEAQLAKVKKIQHNNYINNLQKRNKISNELDQLSGLNTIEINDKKTNDSLLNNDKPLVSTSECLNIDFTNNLEISPGTNKELTNNTISLSKSLNDSNLPNSFPCITTSGLSSNLAVVFPSSFENLQNMQYALLVPTTPQNLPVDFSKTKSYCNSSTQTDESVFSQKSLFLENHEKCVREKLSHLDLCYETRSRKERRSRSESLEERPKWGVNRPPARYVKQSEKDLLYQRRKVRQKLTEIKAYDKHSSDESHNPSPRSYRKKGDTNKRYSRSNWRKEEIFRRDNSAHQTQLIQLQSDKDYIYYKRCHCCCLCRSDKHRYLEESIQLDVLKPDHNYRRNNAIYQTPSNSSEKLPDVESNDEMLVKLSKLHNGLLIKQNEWENVPMT